MNSEKSSSFWLGLIALFVFFLIAIGILHEILSAPWQFITILIGITGTIAASLFALISKINEQILNEQIPKKVEIYQKVINLLLGVVFADKLQKQNLKPYEIEKALLEFTPDLIMWASDDVLSLYVLFRKNPGSSLEAFVKMLIAMRKDLGHTNKGISLQIMLDAFLE